MFDIEVNIDISEMQDLNVSHRPMSLQGLHWYSCVQLVQLSKWWVTS